MAVTDDVSGPERDLRRGAELGELHLAYQPLVDLGDDSMPYVQALVRWDHPTQGLLWPGDFLRDLGDDMLVRMGRWVCKESAIHALRWRRIFPTNPITVVVKLSAAELASEGLAAGLEQLLRVNHLEPEALAVEVSEAVVRSDLDANRARLASVKEVGIEVFVADLGGGARKGDESPEVPAAERVLASLATLADVPVDVLEMDRNLYVPLADGVGGWASVAATIHLAHRFGRRVLATRVETATEADDLRGAGCDLAQGYFFHRPQPAEYIDVLFREARDVAPAATGLRSV